MSKESDQLVSEMEGGSIRALARLITQIENRDTGWLETMKAIYPKTGRARVVGITGPPGAGKSTLTNRLTSELIDKGLSVGIIAVDPSSPFSGGALLGDRLRMREVSSLEGVFVRSMATRGVLGGLSLAARDVVKIMDAFGKDIILIETVGVGQAEVEVVRTADVVAVVCVPGMGDSVQAIKAGIMEIADVFVVNKADREGADQVVLDIRTMLNMSSGKSERKIPILKTVASTGEGVKELNTVLFQELEAQRRETTRQEGRIREEIIGLLEKEVARHVRARWGDNDSLNTAVKEVIACETDPYSLVQEMIAPLFPASMDPL